MFSRKTATALPLLAASVLLLAGSARGQIINDVAKINASDGAAGDRFGWVAYSQDTAVIGAQYDDDNGEQSGGAYIFDLSIPGAPVEVLKLLPLDGIAGDNFGQRVALDGTNALVGSIDRGNGAAGAAYLFDVGSGQQLSKLTAGDATAGDRFGVGLAISGTIALIGAPGDGDNGSQSGSVYLFDISDPLAPVEVGKLLPSDGAPITYFGHEVEIDGNLGIVGAFGAGSGGTRAGSAYIFDLNTGQELHRLEPTDGAPVDYFGLTVGLSGSVALVGSYRDGDNGPYSGSAYLFDANTGQQLAKLLPSDGVAKAGFSFDLAIKGNKAVIGAGEDDYNGVSSGAAYLFDISVPTAPVEVGKFLASDGSAGDQLALSLGFNGLTVVAGAWKDDDIGLDSGSVYVFQVPDCNGNGVPDMDDIANGTSGGCNGNGIPDECELADPSNDWNGDGVLDACVPPNYCTANPNTTGQSGIMSASGSPLLVDNNFTITASQLPPFEWGYFLMSPNQGFIPNVGGSSGNLCLGSPFYRFNKVPTGQVLNSQAGGTFSFTTDLTNLPQGVVFQMGETWNFQAWFRDGFASTSNFTDGIAVMFR